MNENVIKTIKSIAAIDLRIFDVLALLPDGASNLNLKRGSQHLELNEFKNNFHITHYNNICYLRPYIHLNMCKLRVRQWGSWGGWEMSYEDIALDQIRIFSLPNINELIEMCKKPNFKEMINFI